MRVPANIRVQWKCCEECFLKDYDVLWSALSRNSNLLVILNISLFFLTEAVRSGGYYFPLISVGIIAVSILLTLLPLGWHRSMRFYLVNLVLFLAAGTMFVLSVLYWIQNG